MNAEWADGERFSRWVRDRVLLRGCVYANQPSRDGGFDAILDTRWCRAVRRGERNGRLSFPVVDAVATALGYHVSELPDELWIDG